MLKEKVKVPERYLHWQYITKCLWHGHRYQTSWIGMHRDEFLRANRDCYVCGGVVRFTSLEFRS